MRVLLTALAACLALAAPASAASPDIVISQVYGGGGNAGATFKNDFIELYNRGTTPVPSTGWSVQYASTAGTTWTAGPPLTGHDPRRAATTSSQEARRHRRHAVDLPTPNATGTIAMAAGAGKVALVTDNVALTVRRGLRRGARTCATSSATAPPTTSRPRPAPALSNTTAALRAGDGAVDTDNNAADFTPPATPNPRNSRRRRASVTATDPANERRTTCRSTATSRSPSARTVACREHVHDLLHVSGAHAFTLSGGPTDVHARPRGGLRARRRLHGRRVSDTDRRRRRQLHAFAHASASRACGSTTSRARGTARRTRTASSAACPAS